MKLPTKVKRRAKIAAKPGKLAAGAGTAGLVAGVALAMAGKKFGPDVAAKALKALEAKRQ